MGVDEYEFFWLDVGGEHGSEKLFLIYKSVAIEGTDNRGITYTNLNKVTQFYQKNLRRLDHTLSLLSLIVRRLKEGQYHTCFVGICK